MERIDLTRRRIRPGRPLPKRREFAAKKEISLEDAAGMLRAVLFYALPPV